MKPEEVLAVEATILDACKVTVAALARQLAERGLTCEEPNVEACDAEPTRYSSEVRAMIVRGDQIVDVLEFFVFENGAATITPEAAERYTRDVLLDALTNR